MLKPIISNGGYLRVALSHKGRIKLYSIHRLVCEAFIQNPTNLPQVNHIDENKTNNCVSNLEWCDRKYNMNYGNVKNKIGKGTSKKVVQYNGDMEIIKVWDSVKQAQDTLNIRGIYACCRGKQKTALGYKWQYLKE